MAPWALAGCGGARQMSWSPAPAGHTLRLSPCWALEACSAGRDTLPEGLQLSPCRSPAVPPLALVTFSGSVTRGIAIISPSRRPLMLRISFPLQADKRAHHNALERKRRDHIKDSFHSLRDSVPSLQGEKASRAQILDKATEYIQYMRRKNHTHQQDIDDLKRQNALLEQQVRALEKARSSAQLQANYPSSDNSLYTNPKGSTISAFDGGSDSSSDSEPDEPQSRKKLRMEAS
nr:protein max isoform X2 [Dromaius novaehollandiae]